MKGYGKKRKHACCPGHDSDWKHVRKRPGRKNSLRAVKKTARQDGKVHAGTDEESVVHEREIEMNEPANNHTAYFMVQFMAWPKH